MLERVFSLLTQKRCAEERSTKIVLVIAAVAGGVGVSPLLWLLLVVALVLFLTGGGFGYRRGGRV